VSTSNARVVLITGGGTGIGAAAARRFAAQGARVAVLGRRPGPVSEVAAEIGGLAVVADAAITADSIRAVAEVRAAYGHLDVLVTNAGRAERGTAATLDDDGWRRDLDANLMSAAVISRAALPDLIAARGCIVVVASLAGVFAPVGVAGYSTAKHAVVGLAKTMARDFGPHGVRVNVVLAGWTRTELSDETVGHLAERAGVSLQDGYRRIGSGLPLGRVADPDEIAAAIAFLAGGDASFITGAVLPVDGGASVIDASSLAATRISRPDRPSRH
jgi:meso-butanediol dehydrogenase/(S,S)-butanediol dehydrogenase/diacetyl reductase